MDFSKLKLEVYDLVGVILPGLLGIFGVWVLLGGWTPFVASLHQLNGTEFTVLLIVAFGAGNLLQELGVSAIKALKGKRYSRQSRDDFWSSAEALPIKDAITRELGHEVVFVDTAFDYCLTRLKDRFAKRDMFLATSDLCRSLWLLSFLAFVPATRIALENFSPTPRYFVLILGFLLSMFSVAWLSWKRMVRFRELSEETVFRAYLAMVGEHS